MFVAEIKPPATGYGSSSIEKKVMLKLLYMTGIVLPVQPLRPSVHFTYADLTLILGAHYGIQ
jgi:hypothetical protein